MNIRPTHLDNEFRQIFRNLSVPDRTLGLQPEKWVKYAKKSGATMMFMDFRCQFYANHPSDFIPKDPVLGDRDLAEEFSSACRKHGMKYGAYIPPCTVESLEQGHDDWQQRTPDGQKEARNWGFWRTIFCYNTGFRDLYAGHLAEVARKYKVHAFYMLLRDLQGQVPRGNRAGNADRAHVGFAAVAHVYSVAISPGRGDRQAHRRGRA